MGEPRKQFTFYRSYYDALLPLPVEMQARILLAVCAYAIYETEPVGLDTYEMSVFSLIRPTLDSGRRKAAAGASGGRANRKQSASKQEANEKQPESEKEKEKEKEVEKEREKEIEIENENECSLVICTPLSPQGDSGCDIKKDSFYYLADYLNKYYPSNRNDGWSTMWKALLDCHLKEVDKQVIIESLDAWQHSEQWTKDNGKYIPQLSNWISKKRWQQQPPEPKQNKPTWGAADLGPEELEAIRQAMEGT